LSHSLIKCDSLGARATVEAMQAQAPPLPKVEVKTVYDNGLLKNLETEGFVDRIRLR